MNKKQIVIFHGCVLAAHLVGAADVLNGEINILEAIKPGKFPTRESHRQLSLSPEWVGTAELFRLRDPDGIHKDDKSRDIRFSQTWLDRNGNIVIARSNGGSVIGSEMPVFAPNLPSIEELKTVTKLTELRRWFGKQHGWTDGWGSPGRIHWTEGWVWFTTRQDGTLRYLSVFAHVSAAGAKASDEEAIVDILIAHDGVFRPADPKSPAEKAKYKTATEIQAEIENTKAKRRSKYPEPLRSLMQASEAPNDSDLMVYAKAINTIRRNPDNRLFDQLAANIDEGTCRVQRLTEDLLIDGSSAALLEKWHPEGFRVALKQAIAALEHCDTPNGLTTMTEIILRAVAGGHIRVPDGKGGQLIDLEVRIEKTGWSMSEGDASLTKHNLKTAAQALIAWFYDNHPKLLKTPSTQ